jgi:hypothetical protein
MSAETFLSGQGSPFSFNGVDFLATSVQFSQQGNEIDVTDLSVPAGSYRKYAAPPIKDGAEVSVEFIGHQAPAVLTKGDIDFKPTGSGTTPTITGLTGKAICKSVQVTARAGDLLKGTATFRLTYESA